MNKITIKEANIMKYIKRTNNKKLIKAVKKVLETNETMLLKDFLQNFLTAFDSNCYYFYIFYEQLYVDIGLENFHKLFFGLNI